MPPVVRRVYYVTSTESVFGDEIRLGAERVDELQNENYTCSCLLQ